MKKEKKRADLKNAFEADSEISEVDEEDEDQNPEDAPDGE